MMITPSSLIVRVITCLGITISLWLKSVFCNILSLPSVLFFFRKFQKLSSRNFDGMLLITCLRSAVGEARLNHLIRLHVHKELTDNTDMVGVANLFVVDNQQRKQWLGKFT